MNQCNAGAELRRYAAGVQVQTDNTVSVRVAAVQTRDVQEDVDAACACVASWADRAAARGAKLVCFPECFLQGYPRNEAEAQRRAIDLASGAMLRVLDRLKAVEPMLVFGVVERSGDHLFNTAVVVEAGRLVGWYRKRYLLAGERYFTAGEVCRVFEVAGLKFAINICSDTRTRDSADGLAAQGAALLVCPSNNMMSTSNAEQWKDRHLPARAAHARGSGLWLISSDVAGECGGRVSYGPTAVLDSQGRVVAQVPLMEEGMVVADVPVREFEASA